MPRAELDRLSASGLLAVTVPAECGGADVRREILAEIFRLLASADASLAQIPQSHFACVHVIRRQGTSEQREFFFGELLAGRRFGNARRAERRRGRQFPVRGLRHPLRPRLPQPAPPPACRPYPHPARARWKVQHIGRYGLSGTRPPHVSPHLPLVPTHQRRQPPRRRRRRPRHTRHRVRSGPAGTVAYLNQIARAAEDLGFVGALTRLCRHPCAGPAAPPALAPFAS